MEIPKKIIDQVAAKMLDNQIVLEDIAIVPNVFLIYLHRDDHTEIRFLLKTLREQIIVRLNREIAGREKTAPKNAGKLKRIFEFLAGVNLSGKSHSITVPDEWDISFQATDRDVLVGSEVFEITKGEVCVVASYSEAGDKSNNLASYLKTFVTVYKTDDKAAENFVVETAKPPVSNPFETNVESKPAAASAALEPVLAVLTCKYPAAGETETFEMIKDLITIGREKTGDFVLRQASDRISRKHLEIAHLDGRFFLKNFGVYGTTLQGKPVTLSEKVIDNTTRELNNVVEIPDQARIALAGGEVLIDFRQVVNK